MLRKLGFALCVALVAIAGAADTNKSGFRSTEGRFAVGLPGKPEYTQEINPDWPAECKTHCYTYSTSFRAYVVTYALLPRQLQEALAQPLAENPKGEEVRYILDEVVKGLLEASKDAKIVSNELTMTQGFPSRKCKVKLADGTVLYALAVLTPERLYTLATATAASLDNAQAADDFFGSFKVEKPTAKS